MAAQDDSAGRRGRGRGRGRASDSLSRLGRGWQLSSCPQPTGTGQRPKSRTPSNMAILLSVMYRLACANCRTRCSDNNTTAAGGRGQTSRPWHGSRRSSIRRPLLPRVHAAAGTPQRAPATGAAVSPCPSSSCPSSCVVKHDVNVAFVMVGMSKMPMKHQPVAAARPCPDARGAPRSLANAVSPFLSYDETRRPRSSGTAAPERRCPVHPFGSAPCRLPACKKATINSHFNIYFSGATDERR